MTVVLDTSALLYWTIADEHLTMKAVQAITQAEQIIVSSISIWEIGLKVKNAKLSLPLSIQEYVVALKQTDRVQIVPVTEITWLKNLELNWTHKDPADRTIVATASLLSCPLITSDQAIRAFYNRSIW